jgi:uncharacterized protein YqeY
MAIKEKINQDLKTAMLARDEATTTTLRGIKGAILEREVAEMKREQGLTDAEIEQVLQKEIKKRKESLAIYLENNRTELADNEQREINLIQAYLPEQMSEAEILTIINEVIATGETNAGKIIGQAKAKIGTRSDGQTIARLVQERVKQ